MRKRKRMLLLILAVLLLGVLIYSLVQLLQMRKAYSQEEEVHEQLLLYRPDLPGDDETIPIPSSADGPFSFDPTTAESMESPRKPYVNPSILRLKEDHPNGLGWITIPGTAVDYPFVQGPDNDYFLHRDIDGNYLYAGIPFLDSRCSPDLSGENSVIYGHNMHNGTMFGTLDKFLKKDWFEDHREIYVFLEDRTIRAEIVACLMIDPYKQDYLYSMHPDADHLVRVLGDARQKITAQKTVGRRYLTLSTCGYEFEDARIILVALIKDS